VGCPTWKLIGLLSSETTLPSAVRITISSSTRFSKNARLIRSGSFLRADAAAASSSLGVSPAAFTESLAGVLLSSTQPTSTNASEIPITSPAFFRRLFFSIARSTPFPWIRFLSLGSGS
jgi:hypothetical protein